jgi:pimeloyl-ACP methyl ester carboxylesterase
MNPSTAGTRPRSAIRRQAVPAAALLALAGLVYAGAGIASRLVAETRRFRRSADILYRRWASIPAIVGTGKLRIHARVRDVMTNRDAIVLVHGDGIGSSYFVPLAARLSHHAPVFAPDLPGHRPSDHDARPLDVPELGRALAEWMEAMGLRRAVVVGHSLGCHVALHLAAAHPPYVSSLVLIGPTAGPSVRSAKCPIAIVRGTRDRVVLQHRAERLALAAGAAAPIVVPGWGHAMPYDDPDTIAALILGLGNRPGHERSTG